MGTTNGVRIEWPNSFGLSVQEIEKAYAAWQPSDATVTIARTNSWDWRLGCWPGFRTAVLPGLTTPEWRQWGTIIKQCYDEAREFNDEYLGGRAAPCIIRPNRRFGRLGGRIELQSRFIEFNAIRAEEMDIDDLMDTIRHEMIHCWCYTQGLPYQDKHWFFAQKCNELKVSRAKVQSPSRQAKLETGRWIHTCPQCSYVYRTQRWLQRIYICPVHRCQLKMNQPVS